MERQVRVITKGGTNVAPMMKRSSTMGDKGGKKDKAKGKKQNANKQKQKAKIKEGKQPKRQT